MRRRTDLATLTLGARLAPKQTGRRPVLVVAPRDKQVQ
jgi:hypothetical protein